MDDSYKIIFLDINNIIADEIVDMKDGDDIKHEVNNDLDEVMKKYDRESNVRVWTGKPALAVKVLLIGFSLFCI